MRPNPSYEELERRWREGPAVSRARGTVRLICLRTAPGVHECPPRAVLGVERGVEGDRWFDGPRRSDAAQVTLMCARVAELLCSGGAPLDAAGDNFLVELELAEEALPPGTRLRLGTAILEVSAKPHTGCKKFEDRFGADALRWVNDHPARRLRGVNCRVVESGEVSVGDTIEPLVG